MSLLALVPYNLSGTVMHCLSELVVSGRLSLLTGCLHVCACVSHVSMPRLTYQNKSKKDPEVSARLHRSAA